MFLLHIYPLSHISKYIMNINNQLLRIKIFSLISVFSFLLICCLVFLYLPTDTLEIHFKRESITQIDLNVANENNGFDKHKDNDKMLVYREDIEKKNKIVEMMKHAWSSYRKFAWGQNELKPVSKIGFSSNIFGRSSMGATIVDSLDTLYLMGLLDEYLQSRDWIEKHLNFNEDSDVSVFETNIRFLGGLLSCYAITGDELFKSKAYHIGLLILPAFDTSNGIPHSLLNLRTGHSHNSGYWWWRSDSVILAEFGSLHMEFAYLSNITGDPIFLNKVLKIRETIINIQKQSKKGKYSNGLIPNYFDPIKEKMTSDWISIGGMGDSFYEYLLKVWILSGKKDKESKRLYDDIMKSVYENLLLTSPAGNQYFTEMKGQKPLYKMGHLACFSGGMIALGSDHGPNTKDYYLTIAAKITDSCHLSYISTATKIGPETFHFNDKAEAEAVSHREKYYSLRPEVIESYFYMWKLTKQEKYREWAWDIVIALEKYCRTPNGYQGILNVDSTTPSGDDVQQSYFMAETLKYLYLIFSSDSAFDLDKWVMNTEAHMFPIQIKTF